jgi:hypothetical protein
MRGSKNMFRASPSFEMKTDILHSVEKEILFERRKLPPLKSASIKSFTEINTRCKICSSQFTSVIYILFFSILVDKCADINRNLQRNYSLATSEVSYAM